MAGAEPQTASPQRQRRYDRDTPEFGRVANLSDGVFAIAMTLLVLGLEVPAMGKAPLVALWIPVGGLVVATFHGAVTDRVIARRAPLGFGDWA